MLLLRAADQSQKLSPLLTSPRNSEGRDGHNFVLAHTTCNQHNRDTLAAPVHLERWVRRSLDEGAALREMLDSARFPYDVDASMSVAEWSYENAERAGALVWVGGGETLKLSGEWRRVFSTRSMVFRGRGQGHLRAASLFRLFRILRILRTHR